VVFGTGRLPVLPKAAYISWTDRERERRRTERETKTAKEMRRDAKQTEKGHRER